MRRGTLNGASIDAQCATRSRSPISAPSRASLRRRLHRLAEERVGNAVRGGAFDRGVRLERAFHLAAKDVLAADDDDVLDAIDDAEPPVRVHRRRWSPVQEPTPRREFRRRVRVDGSQYPSNSAEPRTTTSPISSPSCATETSGGSAEASYDVAEVSSSGVDSSSSSGASVLRATSTSIAASSSAATRPARAKSSALSSTDVLLAMASSKGRRRLVHTRPPISVMP